jgi:hypothetical protein
MVAAVSTARSKKEDTMAHSWYDTSYRKLFFDFHSHSSAAGLAADFDAERWAERLQEANAQAVSVFTKCGFGWSFYQKGHIRYLHPQLPPGLDMLGQQIDALHRRGLKAIGYYHTFNSEPVARDHPDWVRRDRDGKPLGIDCCLLSPLLDEWMLPHIEEIVTNYDVDSMFFDGTYAHQVCYCDACRRRFAEASGGKELPVVQPGWNTLPPEAAQDPLWREYGKWYLAAYRDVRQRICDTIHKHRPEVVVSVNWAYAPRNPEIVPDGIGALVADIFPDDQVFNGSYFSAYWSTLGKPFDVMNSAFLQWWGDWGSKPALAMQQEVAPVLARGGLTWIGYQMTHRFDVEPAVMAELGKTLAFVKEREPLLEGAQPVANLAVLHSTAAHLAADAPQLFIDELSSRGAHRLLTESMVPFHFLNEEGLLARLGEFKAVILPDQRYVPAELVAALSAWVNAGGALIVTGLTGTMDADGHETGAFAFADLLGVRYDGRYDRSHAYLAVTDARLARGSLDMPHIAEAVTGFACPVAEDVETLAQLHRAYLRGDGQYLLRWSPVGEDSGYPAITLRRVGQGSAVYIANNVFRAYQAKNNWCLKRMVANLLDIMLPEPLIKVDAPVWLEVVPMRQPGAGSERLLVHLLNHHGDRPLDGNNRCTEQILPVRDVTVKIRCPQPADVRLEPGGETASWRYADGVLTVQVPEVVIHRAVAVS